MRTSFPFLIDLILSLQNESCIFYVTVSSDYSQAVVNNCTSVAVYKINEKNCTKLVDVDIELIAWQIIQEPQAIELICVFADRLRVYNKCTGVELFVEEHEMENVNTVTPFVFIKNYVPKFL